MLTEISHAAKRYWGYPEHWIQHWSADLTITSDYVARNHVYVAVNEDQILGFYALLFNDGKLELDHMWVRPQHISGGIGKELFTHAMVLASSLSAQAVEITADPNAEEFYKRMGAIRVGEVRSELDGRPRVLPRLVAYTNSH
jgi:GNAT superfamily N-acetyltransferase